MQNLWELICYYILSEDVEILNCDRQGAMVMQKLSIVFPLWSACIYIRYLAQLARGQSRDILKSRNKCEGAVLGNQDIWLCSSHEKKQPFLVDVYYVIFPIVSNEKSEKSSDLQYLFFFVLFFISVYIFLYIFYCETMAEIVILEELFSKIFFAPQPWWGGGGGALLGIFIFS